MLVVYKHVMSINHYMLYSKNLEHIDHYDTLRNSITTVVVLVDESMLSCSFPPAAG